MVERRQRQRCIIDRRNGRLGGGRAMNLRFPFSAHGVEMLTPFLARHDSPAEPADLNKKDSPRVGKFTHPSGAPDNHLLTVWSPGPVNHQYTYLPQLDGGIYLIKKGEVVEEPAQMLLIKNDPKYNEQWPRAVVPFERIYGMKEPKIIAPLANDGKLSPHLPEPNKQRPFVGLQVPERHTVHVEPLRIDGFQKEADRLLEGCRQVTQPLHRNIPVGVPNLDPHGRRPVYPRGPRQILLRPPTLHTAVAHQAPQRRGRLFDPWHPPILPSWSNSSSAMLPQFDYFPSSILPID